MIASLRYILPIMLLTSCSSSYDLDRINTHPPLLLEYTLVSMEGHDVALKRDKAVLGASNLKETTLSVYSYWSGKQEWYELNIGQCVQYRNMPDGPFEVLHRCTELVEIDGNIKEYLPYVFTGNNFVEKIAPKISEIKKLKDTDEIVLADNNGKEIGRFKFKGAAQ